VPEVLIICLFKVKSAQKKPTTFSGIALNLVKLAKRKARQKNERQKNSIPDLTWSVESFCQLLLLFIRCKLLRTRKSALPLEENTMMREIANIRQIEGEPRRRWFQGEGIDLTVWQEESGNIVEFELCYKIGWEQRALRWEQPAKYGHYLVDDGENRPGTQKASPVLFHYADFNRDWVAQLFAQESRSLEGKIAKSVYEKILQCPLAPRQSFTRDEQPYMTDPLY
jgi:hypothetical protein